MWLGSLRLVFLLLLRSPPTCARLGGGSLLALHRRNVLVGASAFGVGDVSAQAAEGTFCHARLSNAVALGGIWAGLCSPQVYALAESLLPGRSLRTVACKVALCSGFLSTGGNWINMFVRRTSSGTADNLANVVAAVNVRFGRPGLEPEQLRPRTHARTQDP